MTDSSFQILVLNPGSSTLKHARFSGRNCIDEGTLEWNLSSGETTHAFGNWLRTHAWDAVAFRIVHGGPSLTKPTLVTPEVTAILEQTTPLAPLHQPPALQALRWVESALPDVPRIACFDTAFHATLPYTEQRLAIPESFHREGIRRYGFHGLSYESIASKLPSHSVRAAQGKTVVCHLGSGSSLCGMHACQSRVTSMSMTPLDGLMMASRCGRLDPGVVIHWMRQGKSAQEVETWLTKESGLLALSNVSGDMRVLERAAQTEPQAARAIEMFCTTVAREIASAATVLGGLDAIVFTAGIGENSPFVRERIVRQLRWLGVELDLDANTNHATSLHAERSAIEIWRIPTDEQLVIAMHADQWLRSAGER